MKAERSNRFLYNPDLKGFGRDLRGDMTKAEACLWKYVLRAGMMRGFNFKRQRPTGRYILDFFCAPLMLCIEVDGSSHDSEERAMRDVQRDRTMADAGILTIRITNEEVLTQIDEVRERIEAVVDERQALLGASPRQPRRVK